MGCVPDGQRQDGPNHPYLQRPVANAQQQRRRMVETPFVRASQVAVLDLICEQLKGV